MEISKLDKIDQSVNSIKKETSYFEETIKPIFYKMSDYNITDYKQFDSKQLADIKTLLDNTLALSKVLDKEVN